MTAINLNPRVTSSRNPEIGGVPIIHQATFAFGISTLSSIAREFGVPKSNEKAKTIANGLEATGDSDLSARLKGKRFVLSRDGRSFPNFLVKFSKDVTDIIDSLTIDENSEGFYNFAELITDTAREAIKYKTFLKKTLRFSRLLYVNQGDQNLLTFEITGEPQGDGLIQAIFAGGSEDRDIYITFGETSEFKLQ